MKEITVIAIMEILVKITDLIEGITRVVKKTDQVNTHGNIFFKRHKHYTEMLKTTTKRKR